MTVREWWSTARSSLITHRVLKWMWIGLLPVSYLLRSSLIWIVGMSHYAILVGHWSAEEAAKTEVRAEEDPAH